MNTYYTAKDIEELAAKGTRQIELGPKVFLTDFARETAQQLGVDLVEGRSQVVPSKPSTSPRKVSDQYNKPKGCLHGSSSFSEVHAQTTAPSGQSRQDESSSTVNRLVDLVDEVIKRGG